MEAEKPRNLRKESPAGAIAAGVLVVAGIAGGLWWYSQYRKAPDLPASAPVASATPAATPAEAAPTTPQHPIEQVVTLPAEATTPVEPLPSLYDSDPVLLGALAQLGGTDGLAALMNPEGVIQRFVATVDNLPKKKLSPNIIPVRPAAGVFLADDAGTALDGTSGESAIAPENAARYESYVRIVEAVDAQAVVGVYVKYYPLFQQAYRELGYPTGYFNDRLVEVIDHLLAAPDAAGPLPIVRPSVFWQYADPRFESLSAGQKIMLRIGAANASRVKAKLREVRAALVGMPASVTESLPVDGDVQRSALEEAANSPSQKQ